jgi:hypothetical protein
MNGLLDWLSKEQERQIIWASRVGEEPVVDSAAEIKIHKFLGFARLELG